MNEEIKEIPLEKIHSSKLNPRKTFPTEPLKELAQSIKESGLVQPIIVRPSQVQKGKFEIVVGERRYRAHKLIKAKTIKSIVRDLTDSEVRVEMLKENDQREDITNLERGELYADEHDKKGRTFKEIAKICGKSIKFVHHHYQLVKKLSPTVKTLMKPKNGMSKGQNLEYAVARELVTLHKKDQELLAEKAVTYSLTRDQVVERKKIATDVSQEIEVLPEGTKQEKQFKQRLEKQYLDRKFEGQPVLAEVRREILREKKLWVPTPKFEAELSPEMKRLTSMHKDYPNRTVVLSFDGNLSEIDRAIDEMKKMLQEDPQITYFVFIAKI